MTPSAFDWHLMRGVDSMYIVNTEELFTYTKFPGMAIFSAITPSEIAALSGHEIGVDGHTTGIVALPDALKDLVLKRAEDAIRDVNR